MKNYTKPRIKVLYHYMFPDDVISSLHLDGLSQDLASNGWEVEAFPCNRGCRDEDNVYAKSEIHKNVRYSRVWRPNFSQHSFWGRILNSFWMITNWSKLAFLNEERKPDIIIIGTDPIFSALVSIPIKFFSPSIRLVHWCFDMHPEAALAKGIISQKSFLIKILNKFLKKAYRSFDIIVDIGFCMREKLKLYKHNALEFELTPWALIEPKKPPKVDINTRFELFGNAKIGILYSGNLGEAHSFNEFLSIARALRENKEIHFCFAVRGNREEDLKKSLTKYDTNISLSHFAPINILQKRLGSADIHMISLKKKWTGVAVPSKFFGSIAIGRPVLFSGSTESAIGKWITKYNLGWIIDANNINKTVNTLNELVKDKDKLNDIQDHCHKIYNLYFSRSIITKKWQEVLNNLLKS